MRALIRLAASFSNMSTALTFGSAAMEQSVNSVNSSLVDMSGATQQASDGAASSAK